MAGTPATAQRRPPLVHPTGQEPSRIQDLLQSPKTVQRFQQLVPRHLNPERMLRVMAQAVYKTPKLAECEPMTLLGSMMACASFGLEPNTPLGHAYLIPFEKRRKQGNQWVTERVDVNLIIGYRGFIDLARRSGNLVSIHADVVYGAYGDMPADEFSFEYGSNMHLRHVPIGDNQGRPPLWAYAHASLKDGQAFEALPYARVLRIRDNSQGYQAALSAKQEAERNPSQSGWKMRSFDSSPWVAHEHEMAAKTMIRRLSKALPMSIEFANAVQLDAMSDTGGVNYAAFTDEGGRPIDVRIDDVSAAIDHRPEEAMEPVSEGREEALVEAGHDPETGEVHEPPRQEKPAAAKASRKQAPPPAEDDELFTAT
ncbi:recombination protein RecT [Azospirillum oryzae]|uniref:Recombination protein RecT n=1 Tax=Azospirillum oryzae TaxID=286727 RepID=A0A1X7F8I7_9PROT|nr:recombinase RecT [Azospirillum oryzae]SMF47426.1 recombination protein RecT [Azospirillum oryzae]